MKCGQSNQKKVVQLPPVKLYPTRLHKRMHAHKGDVSEGTTHKFLASRTILGQDVSFYSDGTRKLNGLPITDEEVHNSEILRLTHASILVSSPVGDKKKCYVDASRNPVEVWIYNVKAEEYIACAKQAVKNGIPTDYFLDQSLQNIMESSDG